MHSTGTARKSRTRRSIPIAVAIAECALAASLCATALGAATLDFKVFDESGRLRPCRMHVKGADGTPQRAADLPFWRDHFVCPGAATLCLAPGKYDYQVECGAEYRRAAGSVEVAEGATRELSVTLSRLVDMAARGWWSGETHVHRAIDEMPLHLRAEDLHVAAVITWWNERNLWRDKQPPSDTLVKLDEAPWPARYYDVMAGEDEREGGAVLYFGLKQPLPLPGGRGKYPEYPSPMKFVEMARKQPGAWIDIEKPFWWDAPVWLASGKVDSIGLANNHMCHSTMLDNEAWGKPRDATRYPSPRGNGYWTQDIYYHVLNCGLRVPPSAGSASGVLPNPVGYNRAYVYLGGEFTYERWWQGLKAGRSFVTNGPLLICRADGQLPGHVFQAGKPLAIGIEAEVISNDTVRAVEIIKDGQVAGTIALAGGNGEALGGTVTFERSGWFLLRAVSDVPNTFRFASTAPYYVEIGANKSRISRASARFFLDWVGERARRVAKSVKDQNQLREVLAHHDAALAFWQDLLERANAD